MQKKLDNLRSMKADELKKKLMTLTESLRTIHFKAEGAKSKNVKESKGLRKQRAQVMTVMNAQK